MQPTYKLIAVPFLLHEGDYKGHLETVTFIAASENDTHKWWSVNVGTFEKDFTRIVSPEIAKYVAESCVPGGLWSSPTATNWRRSEAVSAAGGKTNELSKDALSPMHSPFEVRLESALA